MPIVDDFDEYEDPAIPIGASGPPGGIRTAGALWLAAGALGIVQGFAHLFINIVAVLGRESPFRNRNHTGFCAGHLLGMFLLVLGFFVFTGRASRAWILTGAFLSILFGLGCGCTGFMAWGLSRHIAENEQGAVYLVAGLDGLQSATLLVASGLALLGERAYAKWQRRGF